jgi:3D (Asp-Asp-Asp) domain-containing protein
MALAHPEISLPRVSVHLRAPRPVEPVLAGSTVARVAAGLAFGLLFGAGAFIVQSTALGRVPAPEGPLPPDIRSVQDVAEPWFAEAEAFAEGVTPASLRPAFRPIVRPRPPRQTPLAMAAAGIRVIATAYTSEVGQTDESPLVTAMNTEVREGVIALSQDLLRSFTPGAPFDFGDVVEAKGIGRFQVEDTMHPRWQKRADIWFPTRADAMRWGSRHVLLKRVTEPK